MFTFLSKIAKNSKPCQNIHLCENGKRTKKSRHVFDGKFCVFCENTEWKFAGTDMYVHKVMHYQLGAFVGCLENKFSNIKHDFHDFLDLRKVLILNICFPPPNPISAPQH